MIIFFHPYLAKRVLGAWHMEYELSTIKGFQAFVALIGVRHNRIGREALSIYVVILSP